MSERWKFLRSEALGDFKIFRVRRDHYVSPITRGEVSFHILEMPDWINVVALTDENKVVLIRQYRYGTKETKLEVPGGVIDGDETPLEAAKRQVGAGKLGQLFLVE